MIELDVATVLLQWATGGLLFLWFTTRKHEMGAGYSWLMRSTFLLLAGGAAAATAAEAAGPLRADAVPAGTARKEGQADRVKARYQGNSAHVQAFYRTNRYGD